MTGVHDFALFVASGILLNLTPGADTLYIVTRGTTMGARAGAVAALGIATGCCLHIVAAALGLSALLAASATAFTAVRFVGAAYLIYLGIALWRTRPVHSVPDRALPAASLPRVFVQGALTNVLNPKVALFFLAFLPQFVDRGASVPPQVAVLGLTFAAIAFASDCLYALLADLLAGRVRRSGRGVRARRYLSGGIFVALGVTAAAAHRSA